MGATLSLGKSKGTDDLIKPEAGPVFDPEGYHGEVSGVDGARYIQGKALFNNAKQYVGPAPKEMWLTPLTPKQEQARKMQMLKNKKFFGSAPAQAASVATIPQAVLNAERENAQARAAESRAA